MRVSHLFILNVMLAVSLQSEFAQTPAAGDCPTTPHVSGFPPTGPQVDNAWYANSDRSIWATFWGWDFVFRGGEQKVLWYKPASALLVDGRRIDGQAAPLMYDIARDPRPQGAMQPSGLAFPTAGCWEVDAQAGNSKLRFVVFVKSTTPAEQYRAALAELTNEINDSAKLTKQQLADAVAGTAQFPERNDWEKRLYAQKEKLDAARRGAINVLQRMLDSPTAEEKDPTKLQENLGNVTSPVGVEYVQYQYLVSEGAGRAADWKRIQ